MAQLTQRCSTGELLSHERFLSATDRNIVRHKNYKRQDTQRKINELAGRPNPIIEVPDFDVYNRHKPKPKPPANDLVPARNNRTRKLQARPDPVLHQTPPPAKRDSFITPLLTSRPSTAHPVPLPTPQPQPTPTPVTPTHTPRPASPPPVQPPPDAPTGVPDAPTTVPDSPTSNCT